MVLLCMAASGSYRVAVSTGMNRLRYIGHVRTSSNRIHWLIAALSVVMCAALTLSAGWFIAERAAKDQFEQTANAILRQTGERIVETRGVLKSMLGMHYASDEFAGVDIEAFAEQLRTYSPFVQAIGMFGVVDGQMREDYEAYFSSTLDHPFSVREWDRSGGSFKPIAPDSQQELWPINLIDPLDEIGLAFLGTDLGSVPEINVVMDSVVRSGQGLLIPMPEGWPITGQALLLQPVYAAAQPPLFENERLESLVGGIWVSIDLESMELANLESFSYANMQLTTSVAGGVNRVLLNTIPTAKSRGVDLGFGDGLSERVWRVGDSRITLKVRAPLQASSTHVALLVAGSILVILLVCAALSIMHLRRSYLAERGRGELALAAEREKARLTLESLSHPVLTFDKDCRCVYLNPAAESALKIVASDAIDEMAETFLKLYDHDTADLLPLCVLCRAITDSDHLEADVCVREHTAHQAVWSMTLTRIAAGGPDGGGYILVLQDVSKERELTSELEHRAHHDALTGTHNRFYFEHRMRELVQDLNVSGQRHALCFIDLDQFKIVNDTCGHAAGDRLLCELTDSLVQLCRETDVFARLGGDEFGLLIVDAGIEDATAIGQKVHQHFQTSAFEHEGKVFPVRASMGLVEIGGANTDMKQIMKAADLACYAAKDGGRNALVVYSPDDVSMNERQEEMNWLPILEKALANDGFELLLQPISSVKSPGKIVRYEYLLRLIDGNDNRVTPNQFLRAAERYDLMRAIDRWVINRAFAMMDESEGVIDTTVGFAINLSGQSVADPELPQYISSAIEKHGVDSARLWFEITETAAIANFTHTVKLIKSVQELGSKVALDDFGTGLSSFAYLRDLPVNVLKIDGRFIRDIARSTVALEMVRAMQHVANTMNIATVAEFVEDESIMNELDSIGIDYAQGWYVGKPESMQYVVSNVQTVQVKTA